MAIVLGDTSGLAEGLMQGGSALAKALGQKQKMKKMGTRLDEIFADLPNNPNQNDYAGVLNSLIGANIPLEYINPYLQMFGPQIEQAAQQQGFQSSLESIFGAQQSGGQGEAMEGGGLQQRPMQSSGQRQGVGEQFTEDQLIQLSASPNPAAKNFAKTMLERKDKSLKNDIEVEKLVKDYKSQVITGFKDFQNTKNRLSRLETLSDKGDLPTPLMAKFLEKINLPLGILNNPDAEEFEKIVADFTTEAKDSFGARVTNFDLTVFLKSIPSLLNSAEGKKRVIKNLSLLRKPKEIEYETMKEVIRDNGGKPPINLQEQVIERIEPKLEKLANDFDFKSATATKNGKTYKIPKYLVKEARKNGFSFESDDLEEN